MNRILVLTLALIFALTGCSTFMEGFREGIGVGNDADGPQTVSSAESNLSLVFPGSWKENELNSIASLQMAQVVREQYLLVIEEYTSDFGYSFTLDDYASTILNNMLNTIDTTDSPVIRDTKIGLDINAKQFEITATVDNIKAKYLVSFAEVNGIFYQFVAWSLQSKYDAAKPVFEEILDSARF
jgi:hypothetical protein